MKFTYDPEADTLRMTLRAADIATSNGDAPGLIVDYDGDGNIVGLTILSASERIDEPHSIEFSEVGRPGVTRAATRGGGGARRQRRRRG